MRESTRIMPCLTFLGALLSLPIIITGIWLATKQDNECVKALQWPVIALGVVFLIVGILGFIAAFNKNPWGMVIYLMFMLVLLALLASMVVFIFLVTGRGHGHSVPYRAYREYDLHDFSGWMRRRVRSFSRWDYIRQCLSSTSTCSSLNQRFTFAQDFFNAHLTPLESGCCKPPTECGFTFVNPTYWISPISQGANPDCMIWSNDQTQLCYSCEACKAGLLANLRKEWRIAGIILLINLAALIWIYMMSCAFFRKTQNQDLFDRHKHGYN